MKLKALTILGLIVFAALIGTALAATRNGYTTDQTQRSEIREHMGNHMGEYENEDWLNEMEQHMDNHWDEMEEHWDSNSLSGHGCH